MGLKNNTWPLIRMKLENQLINDEDNYDGDDGVSGGGGGDSS